MSGLGSVFSLAPSTLAPLLGVDITPPAGVEISSWTQSARDVIISLPLSALLGAALAFRPQRRGTPERSPAVIHTQIILAVVGAVVMLVVGASLARAFGIVGAASLIRYRAKIEDPKDAGVMLSCLGVGLATGVGLYLLAIIATVFLLGLLWLIESFQPEHRRPFQLKIATRQPEVLRPEIEAVLAEHQVRFDLRSMSDSAMSYEVYVPLGQRTDVLSDAILDVNRSAAATVEWLRADNGKRERE